MTGTGAYDAEALKARAAAYRNHVRDEVFLTAFESGTVAWRSCHVT